ncbi:MAG: hypothetical protein HQ515_24150 [Phycisphaeraceae bacterium]|nr:hypothetical protein [Phycisphaeraceae bacterium]
MAVKYCSETVTKLQQQSQQLQLHRPLRIGRFEPGATLSYDVKAVGSSAQAKITLEVKRFVGGGFAGQVYQVEVLKVTGKGIKGLEVGTVRAMKILIPPSRFSQVFRDTLYWVGFQGPFQLQVNPTASRAGALWQKFIQKAAKIRFGDEGTVTDIFGTFVDDQLGSCGELSEWIEGRTWLLEVDDHLDLLQKWRRGKVESHPKLGSAEYRAKYHFMTDFVAMLHEMGAHEFARQYEWTTCKSQPNCLKRKDSGDTPDKGLTAVDFRAGLVLLPYLPMSPGDFKLIAKGIGRGSLVQFDRGNLDTLKAYMESHPKEFAGMGPLFEELKAAEAVYRSSVPDVTHNGLRLLYSGKLWSQIRKSSITGWRVTNLIDKTCEATFLKSPIQALVFVFMSLLGLAGKAVALGGLVAGFGSVVFSWPLLDAAVLMLVDGLVLSAVSRAGRKFLGHAGWRRHYQSLVTQPAYLKKALQGKVLESAVKWHRAGRVTQDTATVIAAKLGLFLIHLPLSILPAGLHHFLTDLAFAKERLALIFVRPLRLYFDSELRNQWMLDMLDEGRKKHMLTDEDATTIRGQLKEPYIQKYLVSLVVHVMTLPVTQVVSAIVAGIFYIQHPDMDSVERGLKIGAIVVLFQIIPISPGSLCRGLYVVYLVIKERDFKNYNIAVFLGFFKYVGYLAFPIQMTYHYPALARFMAGHWATEAVHVVPVFGEHGALLERWVFNLFYNWPLTLRRRMQHRAQTRLKQAPRYWHSLVCAGGAASLLAFGDKVQQDGLGTLPHMTDLWWLVLGVGFGCGALVTLGCRGAALSKRIMCAALIGSLTGALYTLMASQFAAMAQISVQGLGVICIWRMFALTLLVTIGTLVTEILMPE